MRAGPATAKASATFLRTEGSGAARAGILLWTAQIAAFVLLIAAWTQPLLSVRVTARLPAFIPEPFQSMTILDETRSVITMLERLWETNYLVIAGLLFFFGVALPIVKNAGIVLLLASRAGTRSRGIAAALQFVGRFAMVDIFAVSIIVSVMAASTVGQGDNPGPAVVETITQLRSGFYLFVVYVLLSFAIDVALSLRARAPG